MIDVDGRSLEATQHLDCLIIYGFGNTSAHAHRPPKKDTSHNTSRRAGSNRKVDLPPTGNEKQNDLDLNRPVKVVTSS